MVFDQRLNSVWWALRIGLGLGPFLAGLDKYLNLLANWEAYLSPLVPRLLHIQPTTFMHIVGIIEMIVGIAVLTRFTRYAAYIAMIWLVGIAGNLLTTGHYFDIAVRDLEIAIGAFTLARLTEVRQTSMVRSEQPQIRTHVTAREAA